MQMYSHVHLYKKKATTIQQIYEDEEWNEHPRGDQIFEQLTDNWCDFLWWFFFAAKGKQQINENW